MDKIILNNAQSDRLKNLPETGMGYQKVDITLKNGSIFRNRTVLNSVYLILNPGEKINPYEIIDVKLRS